ncbi:MAG: Gfo/Idh/MocA family oxidoreductase [Deltaproteobacteria bacterium]|nr:Gfo/Idh/MocA family oxidoreductase [Candidatus Anaeroferrophillus wilburensis]
MKIYGAGSIGNHLAHGCRSQGWEVTICDLDPAALQRTRTEIYPARYGSWDAAIRLVAPAQVAAEPADLVILGTPPDTHMAIAKTILAGDNPPKVLLIEKPVCTPALEDARELVALQKSSGTFVAVGYNHTLTSNTRRAEELLDNQLIGQPLTISARFREYWGGIFRAHPWLNGPKDSYLGFAARGGGAGGEHSHATNIWQHFAHLVGVGRITEVAAMLDMVDDGTVCYDRVFQVHVKTDAGLVGSIIQDVVTEPAEKMLRIQGTEGFLEWCVNHDASHDAVRYAGSRTEMTEELFAKTRPDDFLGEIEHLGAILGGQSPEASPIALNRGLDTMLVVAAAYQSHQLQRPVRINYDAGYQQEALETV